MYSVADRQCGLCVLLALRGEVLLSVDAGVQSCAVPPVDQYCPCRGGSALAWRLVGAAVVLGPDCTR